MKIETKFDVGEWIYTIESYVRDKGFTGFVGVHLDEMKIGEIEIQIRGKHAYINYSEESSNISTTPEIKCFPHTPEGKQEAEARVKELNEGREG